MILCRQGKLTPGDDFPSTFWITSPLTTLINNTAAGSHGEHGTGIWYLFPDTPVPPSRVFNFFNELEAMRTPISRFFNNVAHSNGDFGLAFFR